MHTLPDYHGGSLVNLMSSLSLGFGAHPSIYPALRVLPASEIAHYRNVVLWVIDGLGHHWLQRHGRDSLLASHLRAPITSVFPSTTSAAIPTFLTGVGPKQHGLTGWYSYFSELGSVLAVLPFKTRLGGSPSIRPDELYGMQPITRWLDADCHQVMPARLANTPFNLALAGSALITPYQTLGDCGKQIERLVIAGKGRQYIYAYWPELDSLAHHHGASSRQCREHLADLDASFSTLVNSLAGTDTLLIVTGDHGLVDIDHTIDLADHPELSDSLLVPLCGEPRAAFCHVRHEKSDAFTQYVTTHLQNAATLHPCQQLIEQDWFGLGRPHPHLAQRIGDFAIIPRDNFAIKQWLPGEKHYVHIAEHGGLSVEEMMVPLICINM